MFNEHAGQSKHVALFRLLFVRCQTTLELKEREVFYTLNFSSSSLFVGQTKFKDWG